MDGPGAPLLVTKHARYEKIVSPMVWLPIPAMDHQAQRRPLIEWGQRSTPSVTA